MQIIRNNSLDPISISNWRWTYFLDETIKKLSTFEPSPYPINNEFLFKESFFGSSSNPKKVILETWGLKTNKIRKARCACLQAGEKTSVMNLVISPACRQAHLACRIFFVLRPHVSKRTFLGLELEPKKDSLKRKSFSIG